MYWPMATSLDRNPGSANKPTRTNKSSTLVDAKSAMARMTISNLRSPSCAFAINSCQAIQSIPCFRESERRNCTNSLLGKCKTHRGHYLSPIGFRPESAFSASLLFPGMQLGRLALSKPIMAQVNFEAGRAMPDVLYQRIVSMARRAKDTMTRVAHGSFTLSEFAGAPSPSTTWTRPQNLAIPNGGYSSANFRRLSASVPRFPR